MISKEKVLKWLINLTQTQQQIPNPHDPNVIAVSEVSRCLRKSFYRRLGIKGESEKNVVTTFIGKAAHKVLLEYLMNEHGFKVKVPCRYRLKEGIALVGEADAVAHDSVIEIKTCPSTPSFLSPYHHLQVTAYMRMLGKKRGYVIYVGRSGHVAVFEVYYSDVVFNKVIKRALALRDALVKNYTPEREYSPFCNSCEYVRRCWVRKSW